MTRRQGKLQVIEKKPFPQYFSTVQKEVLTGLMLGDGCVYKRKQSHTPYLTVIRQLSDKDYLHWCANVFGDMTIYRKEESVLDNRTGKIYDRIVFRTRRLPILEEWHNKWYCNGIKRLPDDLSFSPLTLAVWFADDGHVRSSCSPWRLRLRLSTNGFTKLEVERLSQMLCVRYSERFNTFKSDGQYVVDSSDRGARAFCKEIDPWLPNEIKRKAYWRKPEVRFDEQLPGKVYEKIHQFTTGISKD